MKAVEKVEAHIADALKKGAKVVTGNKRARPGRLFSPEQSAARIMALCSEQAHYREEPGSGE